MLGVITPVVSLIIAYSLATYHFFGMTAPNGFVLSGFVVLRVTTLAIAVTFLGPGALSFDARIFGRREIRIPPLS